MSKCSRLVQVSCSCTINSGISKRENLMQQVKGTTSVVNTVKSKDGTKIAYERRGQGPALILVDGALCYRSFGPMGHLAELLAPHFTVINYDRRGRGDSGDTKPFALEREIEDIEALITEAGGTAYVFGTSSGAALAMEAAVQLGKKIKKRSEER